MVKQIIVGMVAVAWISVGHGEEVKSDQDRIAALEQQLQDLSDEIELQGMEAAGASDPMGKFRFGGYGEVHANFEENGKSVFDIHRLVMYVGYDFSDWIVLNTEIEIEHAFVTDGAGGELLIEQLFVDFLFADALNGAKLVIWNGPMGVFEFPAFAKGTNDLAQILATAVDSGAEVIIGGGDSAAAVKNAGLSSKMSHVSTGGGASLELLEGKTLPGIAALDDKM